MVIRYWRRSWPLNRSVRSLSLMSAVSAGGGSYASYLRIKGETERDIIALRAARTPSLSTRL
ncbi:hypothetical protein BG74_03130 [Sodalis-like endosymbiont of Proechinophthirus fluctus]|nr:hypothetical protein BG74_03130 [Sodalis-like endosymbiont of Proechinophthirus fluctus]